MRKFFQPIGKKFGSYTVLRRGPNNKFNKPQWYCLCECGRERLMDKQRIERATSPCPCDLPDKVKNIRGKKFGRLTPIKFLRLDPAAWWLCRCTCGKEVEVIVCNLGGNSTVSCGCWRREKARERLYKHGESHTPEHVCWLNMIRRCTDPTSEKYPRYGGRGIKVCQRWLDSVKNFIEDMGRVPGPGYTIERDDPDGDYTPENCSWIPREENTADTMHGRLTKRGMQKYEMLGREIPDQPVDIPKHVKEALKRGAETRRGRTWQKCNGCGGKSHKLYCQKCIRKAIKERKSRGL